MSVLKVKNGNQWDVVPAIKGDTGDPAADESITDDMLVTDGIKTEIEWLWGNQLMDSREGELLHAEDAYTAPAVALTVDGKSTQASYTGLNLWDEEWEVGGYSSTSGNVWNTTDRIRSKAENYIPVLPSTTYFHRCSAVNTCCFYDESKSFISSSNALPNATFTTPANAAYMRFAVFPAYGTTYKHDICINVSGSMDGTYEPYTGGKPSPSPDYPQEIVSVENPELTFARKNLLDVFNDPENPRKNTSTAGNGNRPFEYDSAEDAYFTTNFSIVPLVIPADGTYTLTMTAKKTATTGNYFYYLNSYTPSSVLTASYAQHSKTFTATAGQTLTLTIYNTAYVKNIQLELGSTATAYEPYVGTSVPLYDGTLRSLPDGTKDELHLSYLRPSKRAGWAWYSRELVKRVDKLTLDGSQSISATASSGSPDYTYFYYSGADNLKASNDFTAVMCDTLIVVHWSSGGGTTNVTKDIISFGGSSWAKMRALIKTSEIGGTKTALTKAWLAEHPVTIHYDCVPVTTQLDPIELPIMPSRTVNVWSDPATNLKMTYIQDSNLIIENLEATIADIATS